MSAGGSIVLDDDALSGILTHEGDAPGPLKVWELDIWRDVLQRGNPQCATAKLCLLAASKALKDDDGSVEQFHDRLQLREDGYVVDVHELATAADVKLADVKGLDQNIEAVGCAVCLAVNWSRSCGMSIPFSGAGRAPLTTVSVARNALPPNLLRLFAAALVGSNDRAVIFESMAARSGRNGSGRSYADWDPDFPQFIERHIPKITGESTLQVIDFSCNNAAGLEVQPIMEANPMLHTLVLACASIGGTSGELYFPL